MTIFTNTFLTYSAKGNREDLADVIYDISPVEVPFISMSGRGGASAVFHEWQTDALADAVSTNQVLEADDITTPDAVSATTRIGNYNEIARKTVVIGGTQEAVNKAGRGSELGYQLARRGKELKRDMEKSLLANHATVAGNSTTARVTGGLPVWIKTNYNKAANATIPTYTTSPSGTWVYGTERTFTEAMFKDVIQQCWTQGAEPRFALVNGITKQRVSTFAGIATQYKQNSGQSQATIIGAADVYVSDFGVLTVIPDRFQPYQFCFVLDPEYVSVDYLRPIQQFELARTGDAQKRLMLAEYVLKVKNEKALGIVTDLNNT